MTCIPRDLIIAKLEEFGLQMDALTLIWVAFNLCQIYGNLRQIWRVGTHAYVVSVNIPFSIKAFLILLMPAFFCKKSAFFQQNSTFPQINSVTAVLEIF